MDSSIAEKPNLTGPDRLVLRALLSGITDYRIQRTSKTKNCDSDANNDEIFDNVPTKRSNGQCSNAAERSTSGRLILSLCIEDLSNTNSLADDASFESSTVSRKTLADLSALNDPAHVDFTPTVFLTWDISMKSTEWTVWQTILQQYIKWAKTIVRNEADVVMLTHLMLYFTTSVPSAVLLFYRFTIVHGLLHFVMQMWYAGSYTLMMHQHIHMQGILAKKHAWFDRIFPYITDPLMGHTWNSYYFHHVKHHHVEGNGPGDMSSTIRYQRDSYWDFFQYVAKFLLFAWAELPLYFLQKGKPLMALKTSFSELGNYLFLYMMATRFNFGAAFFAFLLPLFLMRIGLMAGNWGQHAFVDEVEPKSDFRSSITLIDVASNRYSFNDGYHTSHHLNPRRHWRNHPQSFLQQNHIYTKEGALVFHDIDYLLMTIKLLQKDYVYLAKRLIPLGNQIDLSIDEIAALLRTKTRRFTEPEILAKFKQC